MYIHISEIYVKILCAVDVGWTTCFVLPKDDLIMFFFGVARSRGFGFVTYESSDCVDKVQDDRPHIVDDKTVDTKRVVPKSVRERDHCHCLCSVLIFEL